jgi:hypothetical protein
VGVNATSGTSDLKNTYVYGDVAYSGPAIANTNNVQGTISTPFSQPVSTVTAPIWTSFNATPTAITNTMTLAGGPKTSPAKFKVSSLNIAGGKVLTLAPSATGVESYMEIWVTGDFTTSGSGYIAQQPGVHVIYHVAGNVTISGSSFNNQTATAANCDVEMISPATGVSQKVTVSGGGAFIGVINGPGADFNISGSASFSGAMIAKTMNISGGASLHYDEALARYTGNGGTSSGWTVASWMEAVR